MSEASSPVLVYQMGKVGSSSITGALSRIPGLEVHQVHRLNVSNIERVQEAHRRRGWPLPPGDEQGLQVIEKYIRPRVPLRIVTLVRDPIARNISYFFQNLDKICNTPSAHSELSVE